MIIRQRIFFERIEHSRQISFLLCRVRGLQFVSPHSQAIWPVLKRHRQQLPDEIPTSSPSVEDNSRPVRMASSSFTRIILSTRLPLYILGMNPAPIPCILCAPGCPPERTGELSGSTATICMLGFCFFNPSATPVSVPPVPTPATKISTFPSVSSHISGRWCGHGPQDLPDCRTDLK